MDTIVMAIKPSFVRYIFSGEKHYEYRTTVCKKQIDKIIIYETSPTSKIVGEVSVLKILKDTPANLWNQTKNYAGIDYESYFSYFKDREIAYAYVLEDPVKYKNPKSLSEYNITSAPQSFIYLKDK